MSEQPSYPIKLSKLLPAYLIHESYKIRQLWQNAINTKRHYEYSKEKHDEFITEFKRLLNRELSIMQFPYYLSQMTSWLNYNGVTDNKKLLNRYYNRNTNKNNYQIYVEYNTGKHQTINVIAHLNDIYYIFYVICNKADKYQIKRLDKRKIVNFTIRDIQPTTIRMSIEHTKAQQLITNYIKCDGCYFKNIEYYQCRECNWDKYVDNYKISELKHKLRNWLVPKHTEQYQFFIDFNFTTLGQSFFDEINPEKTTLTIIL